MRYIVYGRYRECEELPFGCEEEYADTLDEAEAIANEMRLNDDFETVTVEEAV